MTRYVTKINVSHSMNQLENVRFSMFCTHILPNIEQIRHLLVICSVMKNSFSKVIIYLYNCIASLLQANYMTKLQANFTNIQL